MAIESTTGTNTAEMRSARRWIGALLPCACCTRRMIRESTVSLPTPSTRNRSAPFRLSVAPTTWSPDALAHRHRLAGEHRLVHVARAVEDDAVGRHGLAGPHDHFVTRPKRRERHLFLRRRGPPGRRRDGGR